MVEPDQQRAALAALVAERGESLAGLSRLLGRNAAYLQQYLERGSPRLLHEEDRAKLARYFGVAEVQLGGPTVAASVTVPRLDLAASAGPGTLVDEEMAAPLRLDAAFARGLGAKPEALSMIAVRGDSMLPTLADGDAILVDTGARSGGEGIQVVRHDGVLLVKRLRRRGATVELVSDNPDYPPIAVAVGDRLEIVGRVVWMSRRLR
ncbi:helix-turn-helix transcriptional regulator [Sphingomonas sp. ac-8]|uniref:S24 family peptidase n=1 Tax=Sphingomonas sp. ac-8 TaxID=3242977 RepID=UPI003A7FB101